MSWKNVTVDDASMSFGSGWTSSFGDPHYQAGTFHSSSSSDASGSITFKATAIYIFGSKHGDSGGYLAYRLNNGNPSSDYPQPPLDQYTQLFYSATGFDPERTNTLQFYVNGDGKTRFDIDYALITVPGSTPGGSVNPNTGSEKEPAPVPNPVLPSASTSTSGEASARQAGVSRAASSSSSSSSSSALVESSTTSADVTGNSDVPTLSTVSGSTTGLNTIESAAGSSQSIIQGGWQAGPSLPPASVTDGNDNSGSNTPGVGRAVHTNIGPIVGGAVGGGLIVVLALLLLCWYRRRARKTHQTPSELSFVNGDLETLDKASAPSSASGQLVSLSDARHLLNGAALGSPSTLVFVPHHQLTSSHPTLVQYPQYLYVPRTSSSNSPMSVNPPSTVGDPDDPDRGWHGAEAILRWLTRSQPSRSNATPSSRQGAASRTSLSESWYDEISVPPSFRSPEI